MKNNHRSPIFSEIERQVGKLLTNIDKHRKKLKLRFFYYLEERLLKFGNGLDGYYAKPTPLFSRILKKYGFTYIANGASRIAILYKGKYVVKIDREGGGGYSCNKDEYKNYKLMLENDPMMVYCLLPILHSFKFNRHHLLVFPLVQTFNDCFKKGYNLKNRFRGNKKVILKSKYNKTKYKFLNNYFGDTHDDNFGYYKGQIFFIDYDNEYPEESYDYHRCSNNYQFNTVDVKKNEKVIKEMMLLAG